ncbi:MAG: CoA transferase [Chitinophagales bacterium]
MWQNIKVVELASVLAGPLVGSFFAELGAKVVKVENKNTNGDITRQWKLKTENANINFSSYYASCNYGKEILMLDLKDELDYNKIVALIKDADIVIQNFKAGDAEKLHLDADTLLQINPTLIVGVISGFGKGDKRLAYDVVLQAETGFMFMNGEPNSRPLKMPVAMIDVLAAHHLKQAILVALYERNFTKKGQCVSVSLFDAALAALVNQGSGYLMEKHIPQAMGSKHPNIAPYGDMFLTKDNKYIVLAVGSNQQFALLCKILELDNLAKDEKFSTNQQRLFNRNELCILLEKAFLRKNAKDLMQLFLVQKIPAGLVKNLQEVFEEEKAQLMVQEFEIDGFKGKRVRTLLK